MSRSEFDLDLRFGQGVEGCLANLLLRCTVEVKADIKADITGNLCIEFEQDGPDGEKVPSGIAVTTALYWAFYWGTGPMLIVPTPLIKKLARKYYLEGRIKATGDHGNNSVLVPVAALLPGQIQRVK